MNSAFVRQFATLFGAVIALVCAVYVFLIHRRKLRERAKLREEN
tara:strand:- start:725 stop:856 length:132 start_codon:yes stop_codon:yes gene_type:complete